MVVKKDPGYFLKHVKGVAFKNAILNSEVQKLMLLTTEQLEEKFNYTGIDLLLKNAFWNEVRKVEHKLEDEIVPENVFKGICTYTHWFNNILNNPPKLAWMLSPITDVAFGVREVRMWVLKNVTE